MPLILAILVGVVVAALPLSYALLMPRPSLGAQVPAVTLGEASVGSYSVNISVTTSSPSRPLREFSASLTRDGTSLATIDRLDNPGSYQFRFFDQNGDGRLSAGDEFASRSTSFGRYDLRLNWRGQSATNATWVIAPPSVSISFAQVGNQTFWFNVTSAAPASRIENYSASVLVNGYYRDQMPYLYDGISPYGYLEFQDRDGDGFLSAGDRFTVTTDQNGDWNLSVSWRSTIVANETWTVPNR